MEWYVLNGNFNEKTVDKFNIFNSVRFAECVNELVENYDGNKEKFLEDLTRDVKYCFWSKAEYEIMAGGLFDDLDNYVKIDVAAQILPNVGKLAEYILNENYL